MQALNEAPKPRLRRLARAVSPRGCSTALNEAPKPRLRRSPSRCLSLVCGMASLNEAPKPRLRRCRRFKRIWWVRTSLNEAPKPRLRRSRHYQGQTYASKPSLNEAPKPRLRRLGVKSLDPDSAAGPSMKLRSRDFGDRRLRWRLAIRRIRPSMKLRSRDFGDNATDSPARQSTSTLNEAPKPRLRRYAHS